MQRKRSAAARAITKKRGREGTQAADKVVFGCSPPLALESERAMVEVKRERERAGDAASTASGAAAMMRQASAADSEDEDENTPIAQMAFKLSLQEQRDAMIRLHREREEKLKAQHEEECTKLLDKARKLQDIQQKEWSQLQLKNENQLQELEKRLKREREVEKVEREERHARLELERVQRQQAQEVEKVQREKRQAKQSVAQQPPVEERNQQPNEEEVSETEWKRQEALMIAAFTMPDVVQRDGLVTKTEHPADAVSTKRNKVLMEKNEQKSSRQKIVDSPKQAKETMECLQVDATRPFVCKEGQENGKDTPPESEASPTPAPEAFSTFFITAPPLPSKNFLSSFGHVIVISLCM